VGLFLIFGLIGLLSDVANGHGTTYFPLVLGPSAMIGFFLVMIEVMARSTNNTWRLTDRWLRDLLHGEDRP
jgi:hypothetical protein